MQERIIKVGHSPDPDDDVAYVNFTLNNYTTVGNHYPTQFTITSAMESLALEIGSLTFI